MKQSEDEPEEVSILVVF